MKTLDVIYLLALIIGTAYYIYVAIKEYKFFNSGEYKFGALGLLVPTLAYALFLVLMFWSYNRF